MELREVFVDVGNHVPEEAKEPAAQKAVMKMVILYLHLRSSTVIHMSTKNISLDCASTLPNSMLHLPSLETSLALSQYTQKASEKPFQRCLNILSCQHTDLKTHQKKTKQKKIMCIALMSYVTHMKSCL